MIRIFHLSTSRCRIAALGIGDAAEIADSLGLSVEEAHDMLLGPGERRLLGVRDRQHGRLHALLSLTRSSSHSLVLAPRIAPTDQSVALAAEALAELLRALAAAHPFDRLEASCTGDDPAPGLLLAAHGFERDDGAFALSRASTAAARIDVC